MSDFEYGSDEHLDGLSRDALKSEVRWWHGRALEMEAENEKLRELVRDMWRDGMCECDERGACAKCEYGYLDRMRELGVEV